MKKVQITCEAADVLALEDLSVMQGDLKSLSTENYEKLKNQILTNGFSAPFLIWDDVPNSKYWILDGTQRDRTLLKMQAEGYEIPSLPVVWIHAKDRKEAAKKLLSFASQYGRVEGQGLYEFFSVEGIDWREGVQEFNFHELNFPDFAAEFYAETTIASGTSGSGANDDNIPEAAPEIVSLGDVWVLGRHRLMCADSSISENIETLMASHKAHMVFTDPPYGMNLDTNFAITNRVKGKKYRPVIGDDQDYDPSFLLKFFEYCDEIFLWGADYYCQRIPKNGAWVVWDKKMESLDESIGTGFELCWSKQPHKRMIARFLWSGFTAKERDEGRVHPTQKPIALCKWFLDRWGKSEDNVVDLFGGSGSTLLACERSDRNCYMMELDPKYCDTIIKRWQDSTGREAVKAPAAHDF